MKKVLKRSPTYLLGRSLGEADFKGLEEDTEVKIPLPVRETSQKLKVSISFTLFLNIT